MKQFALFVVVALLCVPCLAQECYKDPLTGRQVCPLKKAAAVTGNVVSKVGAAITPNSVPLQVQPYQSYALATTYSYPVQSVPVQSYQYQSSQSYGWSKSWTVVPNQPVRNGLRRFLGR